MHETWIYGDIHFGHSNILTFKDNNGNLIRPGFKDIDHHDETIIANINAVVKPQDRLYLLGDIAFNNTNLAKVGRLNGRKKLIKGNHDLQEAKDYLKYFEDILAYRVYPKEGIIFSHIPVHPCQLENRFKFNVHGHLHSNLVQKCNTKDLRYINVCPEHTKMLAVNLDDIIKNTSKGYYTT